ncbi:hypothetical protein [Herbiconiux sp. A18JL235]|uniref:Uncharacterized protein n=1 Tax=Herbiconiux sp. A18JL235 TaxID=3152363 RepID=A0AB39BC50_9MICO
MLRIRRSGYKVLYVIGAIIVIIAFGFFRQSLHLAEWPQAVLGDLISVAAFFVGARVFRGRGEAIAPPRAWWRTTARPTAGFVLTAYFLMTVVYTFVTAVIDPTVTLAATVVSALSGVLLAAAYLNSSVRLLRTPPPVVEEQPALSKFKPMK